jgi:hypothetical protein
MDSANSSPAIIVTPESEGDSFHVEVRATSTTQHRVTASAAYLQELGVGSFQASHVVHEAFEFLLEHEPNTAILSAFDLREIERYFPAFRRQIAQRMRG